MEISKLSVERYKGYAHPTEVEFAPLTILVGANNSGKTALAQSLQLLAGGIVPSGSVSSEPLPLESGGIQHGETFTDLVTERTVHGSLRISATLSDPVSEFGLSVTVRNVVSPNGPSTRQVSEWHLLSGSDEIVLKRTGFDDPPEYDVFISGSPPTRRPLYWQGLIPWQTLDLAGWAEPRIADLRAWANGVRHLRCPRRLRPSPFFTPETSPTFLGPYGQETPLALAANDALRESVRKWYRNTFGETIGISAQGNYSELVAAAPSHDLDVRVAHSGRGLSHVLPVVVTALTASEAGPGVDVIEHPEAELHPAAHAHVADLLLANLAGPQRPLVIETHSEMLLLRARRWVAEGRIPADDVVVYWVHTEPGLGSAIRRIRIRENGELDRWPDGVFVEDYEEILAIRRAARDRM